MLGPWPFVLALLAPPVEPVEPIEHDLETDSCVMVVEVGERGPERTLECPTWTIVQPFPEDPDLDVLLVPSSSSPGYRRSCQLYLTRVRYSFVDAMIQQAAGMLANPTSSAPRPRVGPRGCS